MPLKVYRLSYDFYVTAESRDAAHQVIEDAIAPFAPGDDDDGVSATIDMAYDEGWVETQLIPDRSSA